MKQNLVVMLRTGNELGFSGFVVVIALAESRTTIRPLLTNKFVNLGMMGSVKRSLRVIDVYPDLDTTQVRFHIILGPVPVTFPRA